MHTYTFSCFNKTSIKLHQAFAKLPIGRALLLGGFRRNCSCAYGSRVKIPHPITPICHRSNEDQTPDMQMKYKTSYYCGPLQGAFMINPHQEKEC